MAQRLAAGGFYVLYPHYLEVRSSHGASDTDYAAWAAVVDWSGSLPDTAFHNATRIPPMLILHGSDDSNVPVINAQQLIRLCELAKQHCDSEIYPGDGHVFPNHHDDAWQRTFAFIRAQAASSTAAQPVPGSGNLSSPTHP
ncbi:prolyl oligopeptidase family serine peptidase [Terriglobus sp.]|uniref:prolyl oligopeptidase family serine peptidase n=1 Tax=Terriglobus sp. TaxID=1889013 RepID=UPI003B00D255